MLSHSSLTKPHLQWGSGAAALLALSLVFGCASTGQPDAAGPSSAATESSSDEGDGANSNPVLVEMTKVLDLDSNPNEPITGENLLATDGTGTMTVHVQKLTLLTPPARNLAMAALGISAPEKADLTLNPIRVRTEISRPGGALRAKTLLQLAVVSQPTFLAFLKESPAADSYKGALRASGVTFGGDGAPVGADGKVVEIAVSFGDNQSFALESIKVRQ